MELAILFPKCSNVVCFPFEMGPDDENRIRTHYVKLGQHMNGEKVARFLYTWKIFDKDDEDRVCAQTTRSDQNYRLLDLILHKGPMAYKQFRQALMETNSQHLVDLLDKSPVVSEETEMDQPTVGLPCKIINLVGRTELCGGLVHSVLVENQQKLTILSAPPGFGKSSVATNVSHTLIDKKVCQVLFCTLRHASSLTAVVSDILRNAGITVGTKPVQQAKEFFRSCTQKTVLVLDNAEDMLQEQHKEPFQHFLEYVTQYAPHVHTLVTSRKPVEGLQLALDNTRVSQIPLKALDAEESAELMRILSPNLPDHIAKQLGELCRGVPLFIQLAASFVRNGESAMLLIQDLRSQPERVLKIDHPNFQQFHWDLSLFFKRLPSELRDALLSVAVFPVSFSEEEAWTLLFPGKTAWDCRSLLIRLESYSLLHRDTDSQKLSLHPLVQAFCKDYSIEGPSKYSLAMKQFIQMYLELLRQHNRWFISPQCKDAIDQYEVNKDNIKHALKNSAMDPYMKVYGIDVSTEVVNFLAKVLDINEFLQIYEGFQDAARAMEDSYRCGTCLTSIGFKQLCYHGRQFSSEAKATLSKAMHLWANAEERQPDKECFAHCLSKLGLCLVREGKTEEGVCKIAQAIRIRKKLILASERDNGVTERMLLGGSYCDLAMALYTIKEHKAAIRIWTRYSLVLYQELLGDHPFTATLLDYIGAAYQDLGQIPKAVYFKHWSLKMRTSLLTEYHPDTARAFYGLGCVLAEQGPESREEALEMLNRALKIQVRVHGSPGDVKKTQQMITKLTDDDQVSNRLRSCHIGLNSAKQNQIECLG